MIDYCCNHKAWLHVDLGGEGRKFWFDNKMASSNRKKNSARQSDIDKTAFKDLRISPASNARNPQRSPRSTRSTGERTTTSKQPSQTTVIVRSNNNKMAAKATSQSKVGLVPKDYTCRPIIPAEKAELLPVARAMHREQFAERVKKLFDPEREAAIEAIQSGVYIGWRTEGIKHDCIRVGSNSKCFCAHLLHQHGKYNGNSVRVPCVVARCKCKAFAFVPSRAEEVGEFWLQRRPNFDPSTWRAKCKCKHTHEEHEPNGIRGCRARCCGCSTFFSNFLCCACDKHWEDHETVFETEAMRKTEGIPYGQDYLPFNELPELRNVVLTGREDDDSQYQKLTDGVYAVPKDAPTDLAMQLRGGGIAHRRNPFE